MRIGLDYRPAIAAPSSGIGRQVLALEQAMLARGDIALERFSEAPLDHPLRLSGYCHFPPWPCPLHGMHRPKQRLRFETRFLPAQLRRLRPELYIATANMGMPLPARTSATRHILLLHDVFQLTEHNYHASALKKLAYRCIDRASILYSLRVAHRVWTPSRYTSAEVIRLFPFCAGKTRVLPNQITPFTVSPALPGGNGLPEKFWLAVGTREPRKNIPLFVSAWRAARQLQPGDVPDLVLVGNRDDLPAAQRGLDGVHVLGELSDAEMHALYRTAHYFWQPAFAEGFGMPVIEALSTGTPVAVARGSALDEITPPEAPRFDPRDEAALTRLMLELAAINRQPAQDGDNLRAWAGRYNEQAYRCRLYELLEDACR